jgi:hypothetical protein
LKFHNPYECREREYRHKHCSGILKKKSTNSFKLTVLDKNKKSDVSNLSHTESSEVNNLKIRIELDLDKNCTSKAKEDIMILI